MRTGLHKQDKTTEITFDEASPIIEVRTHNTDLKNRLTKFIVEFPDLCRMTNEDEETGYKAFEICKGRLSIRLTASYSEERRNKYRELAKENGVHKKFRTK